MISLIIRNLPAVLVAIAAGLCVWWVMHLRADNASLLANNARLTLQLSGCNARSTNLTEDKESDARIDNMPDLRSVPDSWLLPEVGAGGIY